MQINWSPANRATSYRVEVATPGESTQILTTSNTFVQVPLSPSVQHAVVVTGVNSVGDGPSSDPAVYSPPLPPEKVEGVVIIA